MAWTVDIGQVAEKQLAKLDAEVRRRDWLDDRIDGCKNPRHFGEPLKGGHKGLWRYRVGDYRILCDIRDDRLVVIAIAVGHRKEIHRK